jgi:hypothetical protein
LLKRRPVTSETIISARLIKSSAGLKGKEKIVQCGNFLGDSGKAALDRFQPGRQEQPRPRHGRI